MLWSPPTVLPRGGVWMIPGQLDGGVGRVDRVDDLRRPEDLGAEDVHIGGHVGEDDRPDERSVRSLDRSVAGEQAGSLGGGVLDYLRDTLRATRVDEGPDDRCGIGGVADAQGLDPLHIPRDERNRVQGREGIVGIVALGSHDRWAPNGRDWRDDYLRSLPAPRIWSRCGPGRRIRAGHRTSRCGWTGPGRPP